jgi:hypothetical protein
MYRAHVQFCIWYKLNSHFSDELWKHSRPMFGYLQYHSIHYFLSLLVSFERRFLAAVSKFTWQCGTEWSGKKPVSYVMHQHHATNSYRSGGRQKSLVSFMLWLLQPHQQNPPVLKCSDCFNHINRTPSTFLLKIEPWQFNLHNLHVHTLLRKHKFF